MKKLSELKPNILIMSCILLEVGLSILGKRLGWLSFLPQSIYSIIAGASVIAIGYIIHFSCHWSHKKGHQISDKITDVVCKGPYKYIRHPMYTGILMVIWGLYIIWSFMLTLIMPVFATTLVVLIAKSEEKYLSGHLGDSYLKYKKKVKKMFIPGII